MLANFTRSSAFSLFHITNKDIKQIWQQLPTFDVYAQLYDEKE